MQPFAVYLDQVAKRVFAEPAGPAIESLPGVKMFVGVRTARSAAEAVETFMQQNKDKIAQAFRPIQWWQRWLNLKPAPVVFQITIE